MEMEELPGAQSPASLETKWRLKCLFSMCSYRKMGDGDGKIPEAESSASLANKWRQSRDHVSNKVAGKHQQSDCPLKSTSM